MGQSESKFRPEPQDIWYKVRSTKQQPKLLLSVLQAIVDLKDSGVTNYSRIVEYLQGVVKYRDITPRPRGLPLQVKRALKHAVDNGLVKHNNGKYSSALNSKDFEIFRSFRSTDPIFGSFEKRTRKSPIVKGKSKYKSNQRIRKCKTCKSKGQGQNKRHRNPISSDYS